MKAIVQVRVEKAIKNLDKESLCQALRKAKTAYIFSDKKGRIYDKEYDWTLHKNLFTFGLSALYRSKKANMRLPKDIDITDANSKELLQKFLTGEGEKNKFSLKYLVVSSLLNYFVESDQEAKQLVNLAENILAKNILNDQCILQSLQMKK